MPIARSAVTAYVYLMEQSSSTRQEILARLRHKPMTIAELVDALGVTRNAVLVPLANLERAGLVRRQRAERTGRVGKPAQYYVLVPEGFEKTSPAYQVLAPHLLAAIVSVNGGDMNRSMKTIGTSMHADLASGLGTHRAVGLGSALIFLTQQGAEIEVIVDGADTLVLSHSCPIGVLVRTNRCMCLAIAAFLSEATGKKVTNECSYGDKLTCRFRIRARRSSLVRKKTAAQPK